MKKNLSQFHSGFSDRNYSSCGLEEQKVDGPGHVALVVGLHS
jgi:hypothetical protein